MHTCVCAFRSLVIRAQISTNLGNLLTDIAHRTFGISFGIKAAIRLLIVLFEMNDRNAKLGQFPDLFLHYAAERRNYQNTSIGVCRLPRKTLDISSSL